MLRFVAPHIQYLDAYAKALRQGWSPDNIRLEAAAIEELEKIRSNPVNFVESLTDLEAKGEPIVLLDGSRVPRLPGFRLWLWEEEFCGSFGFRYQPGGPALPPHCLGHVGYSIVPWQRHQGYATRGLAMFLEIVKPSKLPYVELTTKIDNVPSQKVILANGGVLVEEFEEPAAYGSARAYRYRIDLSNVPGER